MLVMIGFGGEVLLWFLWLYDLSKYYENLIDNALCTHIENNEDDDLF